MPHHNLRVTPGASVLLLAVAQALGAGCADPTGSVGGTLRVTASTTGLDPDLDGYAVTVDDQVGRRLARNATLTVSDLEPGAHRVLLDDLAPNCSVGGENPRSLDLDAGATMTVTFQVTCTAATGALALQTITTGEGRDPDGYTAAVDGRSNLRLDDDGRITMASLAPGDHTVALADVVTNCQVAGDANRTVTVQAGATAELTFAVTCVGRTLHVSVGTTGPAPDGDGYGVAVDGGAPQAIGVAGSLDVGGLTDGAHAVALSGLAPFCGTPGNPRTVQLSETGASVRFDVTCPGPPVEGRILYNGAVGDEVHVFVMQGDGSGRTDLTPHANGFSAHWSPNRDRIVFETTRNGDSEVFVMNADGSRPTRLTAGRSPSWSPDGDRIAFIANGDVRLIDADGSHLRLLVTGRQPDAPAWSPDGRMIVYVQVNSTQCALLFYDPICARDLFVVNADGTGLRQLTHAPDAVTWSIAPAWSPDGSTIAFFRSTFGVAGDLYLVAPDGSQRVQLTASDQVTEGYPVWSPDGRALAFAERSGNGEFDIALMPREGGAVAPLVSQPGEQLATSWR
jgi:Tol biopolymer transport system component